MGTIIAVVGVFFAGWALLQNAQQTRRSATFAHLRDVQQAVKTVRLGDPDIQRTQILSFYRGETDQLDSQAADYLSLLDTFDLLALAREHRAVSRRVVDGYMGTLIGEGLIDEPFLDEFRNICNDPEIYQHLQTYIADQRPSKEMAKEG